MDLREAPEAPSAPEVDVAPTTTALEQLPITEASLPPSETSTGPAKVGEEWLMAKKLPLVELGQSLRANRLVKVKGFPKLNLCQSPRAQRLAKARELLPRQRSPSRPSLKI